MIDEPLDIHFQPIVSLRQKTIVGVEALARHPALPIGEVFARAQRVGQLVELDRRCRREAMRAYRRLPHGGAAHPVLFLNLHASTIDGDLDRADVLLDQELASGIRPQDIIIEINETHVAHMPALRRFVDSCRAHGFPIALDDLGVGASNLSRIAELRPHILKLDRSLVQGIHRDFFRRETFKSMVRLGHHIGALILAEGVEEEAEVELCASLGAELFQGFHFERPLPAPLIDYARLRRRLHRSAERQRRRAVTAMRNRRSQARRLRVLSLQLGLGLGQTTQMDFERTLGSLVRKDPAVECAYVTNLDGIQVTETVSPRHLTGRTGRLFAPARKGADHSTKEYFYGLADAGLELYLTEPYLSMATGHLCRTVSRVVQDADGARFVLCLDLRVDGAEGSGETV